MPAREQDLPCQRPRRALRVGRRGGTLRRRSWRGACSRARRCHSPVASGNRCPTRRRPGSLGSSQLSSSPAAPARLTKRPHRSCRPYRWAISRPLGSEPSPARLASAHCHACCRRSRLAPPLTASALAVGAWPRKTVRRQLVLAMAFTDTRTIQEVIDSAVQDFLAQLRDSLPGFAEAADAAEASATGRPPNVTHLRPNR
jgi:hypothetical protein